jgi:two-component system nitrate/nitrite response regulator NarL
VAATVSKAPIRLVISDATRMGCQLLREALQRCRREFTVLGSAVTGPDLLKAVETHEPDLVLVSARLEDSAQGGMIALRSIHGRYPHIPAVYIMDSRNGASAVEAFRAGAKGVFFRVDDFEMLCKCIHSVHEGQVWAGASEMRQILEALLLAVPMRVVDARGDELLTKRQQQLVSLATEGFTNREIAQQLRLSEHTVKNYFFRIFDKLGVSSRAELIIYTLNQMNRVEQAKVS